MSRLESPPTGLQSSRRNLFRAAALAGAWAVAKATSAKAHWDDDDDDDHRRHHHRHCFLKGTTIRTISGDRRIEDLGVGDLLPTMFHGSQPIQWIARYRFTKSNPKKAWVKSVQPIRIGQSALAPGVPHNSLYVTEAHAVLIDEVLVEAGNLITDKIARQDLRAVAELEFFHIKLARHDVIWAEGAPCETLVSVDENAANFADYLRGYGPQHDEPLCAPRIRYEYTRGEIKSQLRSAISPWTDLRTTGDLIRERLEALATVK